MPVRATSALIACTLLVSSPVSASESTGAELYKRNCAWCHGDAGQGSKRYGAPLVGDRSVAQLADLIDRTMPEDDPDKVNAAESRKIADYIQEAFYSPRAQARNKPPRIELSRLTVRQYRQSVADLVGEFRGEPSADGREGLNARFYDSRRHDEKKKVEKRIDAGVDFHWSAEGPIPGKLNPKQYAVRWDGAVRAPATGWYDLVVRTSGATRVWFNRMWPHNPLIDAGVQSGTDSEFKEPIYLVEGRVYPIQIDFSQADQGVGDAKDHLKRPAKPTYFTLAWRPPNGAVRPIPARHLLATGWAPEVFAVSTPFPPDDRSLGWERGTTISKAWDAATTDAALEAAGYVVANLDQLAGVKEGGKNRREKVEAFAKQFVERAFRRPLSPEQAALYVAQPLSGGDFELGMKRVVLMALKSPRFLYREVGGGGADGFDVAARLAFALWDSLPDHELRRAAAAGELAKPDNVRRQAERMLLNPRARAKLADFFRTWLKIDQAHDMVKDQKKFPGFDAAVVADLQESLERMIDEIVWGDDPDFRRLLTSRDLYLNGRLAAFYGAKLPADAPFTKVPLDGQPRAGVLTHPYLMAVFAHGHSSSPIHRGVFVARNVLGINLRPPQEAIAPISEELHPSLTTRDRVALQTGAVACATCHTVINPLGFTLEPFDAVGRFRTRDNNKPIDPTGSYQDADGKVVKLAGPRELGAYLAASPKVHEAFAEQLFHHLAQQPVRAYGMDRLDDFRQEFAANRFDVRKLAASVAVAVARTPRGGAAAQKVSARP